MSDFPLTGATAPIVGPHDFCKGPQVVFDQNGLVIRLFYSKGRDANDQSCWLLAASFELWSWEGEWEYDIPDTMAIRQFAGECIIRAWNEGRLEVKQ